jgi:hypothetical protein
LSQQPATAAFHDASRRIPAYKKILLEKLFNYSAAGTPESNLDFFWHAGRTGLDAEDLELEAEQAGGVDAVLGSDN